MGDFDNYSEEDQHRLKAIALGIKRLYLANNRVVARPVIIDKAKMLNQTLDDIPVSKLGEFFDWLKDRDGGIPSDGQIRSLWYANKGAVFGIGGGGVLVEYGYYDANGTYTPNGTYNTFLNALESQLDKRQKEVRKAYFDSKCRIPQDMKADFDSFMEIKFWVPKGRVQKPRKYWNEQDYRKSGITDHTEIKEHMAAFA